jgi:hypothetical protein
MCDPPNQVELCRFRVAAGVSVGKKSRDSEHSGISAAYVTISQEHGYGSLWACHNRTKRFAIALQLHWKLEATLGQQATEERKIVF